MSKQVIHYKKVRGQKKQQTKKQAVKSPLAENGNFKQRLFLAFIAVAFTFLVYLPTFNNDFTNWDDTHYVLENHLINKLDWDTIKKYFFSDKSYERYFMGNYHPLTMLTYNLNYLVAAKDENGTPSPFPFQFTNILLHLFSVFFVFLIVFKLSKNNFIAFLSALFFGIHTLHVESVAWISERKDVLYTAFYFLALYLYILYVERSKLKFYFLSLLVFLLSLLSKGQAVTLSLSIVLIDIWYERKLLDKKIVAEKIPFFALSLIFGLIAIEAQKYSSALQSEANYELYKRFAIASYGFTMYLAKLIFPFKLSAIYPYPDLINKTVPFYFWLSLIPTLAILFLTFYAYKKGWKTVFFGLAFFIANIATLLQIIPVGGAILADRYSYVPSLGIHFLIAWMIYKFLYSKENLKKFTYFAVGLYAIVLAFLTVDRIKVWQNSETLWRDTVAKEPTAVVAWNNLGSELNKKAEKLLEKNLVDDYKKLKQEAIECFTKAIKFKPDYKHAFYNRGATKYNLATQFNDTSLINSAIDDLTKAIAIDPVFTEAYRERGLAYDWIGDFEKALSDYKIAIQLEPKNPQNYVNRAVTYGKSGDYNNAIKDLLTASELKQDMPEIYSNLGLAYYYSGDNEKALENFNKALDLEPGNPDTYFNRSLVFAAQKDFDKALQDVNKAIELGNTSGRVYYFKAVYSYYLGNKDCDAMKTAIDKGFELAKINWQKYCGK